MHSIETSLFNQRIHGVRNSLNSINLHAELGKMLIENGAGPEQIKSALAVISQECISCERLISEMSKATSTP